MFEHPQTWNHCTVLETFNLHYTEIILEREDTRRTLDEVSVYLCVVKRFVNHTLTQDAIVDTRFYISNQVARCYDLGFDRETCEEVLIVTHFGDNNDRIAIVCVAIFNRRTVIIRRIWGNHTRNL